MVNGDEMARLREHIPDELLSVARERVPTEGDHSFYLGYSTAFIHATELINDLAGKGLIGKDQRLLATNLFMSFAIAAGEKVT